MADGQQPGMNPEEFGLGNDFDQALADAGGEAGAGERRRLLEAPAARHFDPGVAGEDDLLAQHAIARPAAEGGRVIVGAELAIPPVGEEVCHHAIPPLKVGDRIPHRDDLTGPVRKRHERGSSGRAGDEKVTIIERYRVDANRDVQRTERR